MSRDTLFDTSFMTPHNHIRITNYALKPLTENLAGFVTISKKRIHVHKASDSRRRSELKGRLY